MYATELSRRAQRLLSPLGETEKYLLGAAVTTAPPPPPPGAAVVVVVVLGVLVGTVGLAVVVVVGLMIEVCTCPPRLTAWPAGGGTNGAGVGAATMASVI